MSVREDELHAVGFKHLEGRDDDDDLITLPLRDVVVAGDDVEEHHRAGREVERHVVLENPAGSKRHGSGRPPADDVGIADGYEVRVAHSG